MKLVERRIHDTLSTRGQDVVHEARVRARHDGVANLDDVQRKLQCFVAADAMNVAKTRRAQGSP
jgi:hypothetical protein